MVKRACVRGFTLVELLVTASIVILLGTFAVPKAFAAMYSSREAQVNQDLQTIQDALEQHYLDLNYYPNKLNDLVDRGYLQPGANFKSPISGYWYFYAVDDNYDTERFRAKAYALGAPGKDSASISLPQLHHSGPLPKGRRPDWRAWAWLHANGGSTLFLYDQDDQTSIDSNLPKNLAFYRTSCQGSAEECDLITN